MTVTIIGTVVARPETRDELEKLLAAQVGPTRAEPGCINYDFHVDAQDDLDAHMRMPHLAPLLGNVERLLAKPVIIRHLRMLGAFGQN